MKESRDLKILDATIIQRLTDPVSIMHLTAETGMQNVSLTNHAVNS